MYLGSGLSPAVLRNGPEIPHNASQTTEQQTALPNLTVLLFKPLMYVSVCASLPAFESDNFSISNITTGIMVHMLYNNTKHPHIEHSSTDHLCISWLRYKVPLSLNIKSALFFFIFVL
eukprot:NODE_525_length_7233_cov_0.321374.p6 type:complete len:118 gc:universal NODE_525_length_7233_cov_0.321374:6214-6567(+)